MMRRSRGRPTGRARRFGFARFEASDAVVSDGGDGCDLPEVSRRNARRLGGRDCQPRLRRVRDCGSGSKPVGLRPRPRVLGLGIIPPAQPATERRSCTRSRRSTLRRGETGNVTGGGVWRVVGVKSAMPNTPPGTPCASRNGRAVPADRRRYQGLARKNPLGCTRSDNPGSRVEITTWSPGCARRRAEGRVAALGMDARPRR
jgi:hypothetical protein